MPPSSDISLGMRPSPKASHQSPKRGTPGGYVPSSRRGASAYVSAVVHTCPTARTSAPHRYTCCRA
jgi:hypothetical protein